MKVIAGAGRFTEPGVSVSTHWAEQLKVTDLSVGTYSIRSGGTDDQAPHAEDEIYVITGGQAVLASGGDRAAVGPGSVVYVPAGEVHRFTEVTGEFAALVLFAPAEGSREAAAPDGG